MTAASGSCRTGWTRSEERLLRTQVTGLTGVLNAASEIPARHGNRYQIPWEGICFPEGPGAGRIVVSSWHAVDGQDRPPQRMWENIAARRWVLRERRTNRSLLNEPPQSDNRRAVNKVLSLWDHTVRPDHPDVGGVERWSGWERIQHHTVPRCFGLICWNVSAYLGLPCL